MSIELFKQRIADVRTLAAEFPKRRSDAKLYEILGRCLALCEDIAAAGALDELKRQYAATEDEQGRNRRYFERSSDVYAVVGRLAFETDSRNTAAWRYSVAIRRAHERGVSGQDLPAWLAKNGGVNALFRTRPVKARKATTKTLHLNQPVEVPKGGEIILTLRRCDTGFFDVLAVHEPMQEAAE